MRIACGIQRRYLWVIVLGLSPLLAGCPAADSAKKTDASKGTASKETAASKKTVTSSAGSASTTSSASATGATSAAQPAAAAADSAATKPEKQPEAKPVAADANLVKTPLGLPPVPVPADNPMTAEKIELGKMLYFDKRLSKDGTVSCATCHDPTMAWAEHTPTSKGIGGQFGERNSPTVINAAYATSQFWDGRAATLEEQALGPIENPIEMGHHLDAMIADLSKIDEYKQRFQTVFGTGITKEGIAKAIAAFERTVLSGNSPYDRFKAGDAAALDAAQKHGLELFDDHCAMCHTPPVMSNFRFFNAGVGVGKEKPDQGRMAATKQERDLGKFRTPALREVANTAPYFHDGSAKTLDEAVALMADGGKDNPQLSSQLKAVREAKLSEQDRKDLVAFLNALSGEYPIVEAPK